MGKAIRVGLFAGVLAVCACGGGGGGGGGPTGPNALLQGSYVYLYLDRDVAGDGVYSEVATFAADGAGGIVFGQGWQTGEGGPGVYVRRANSGYGVAADGGLTITGGFPSTLTGRVSAGGTYAAAVALAAGTDPGWFCAARRDTSPTLAEVSGSWFLVEYRRRSSSPDSASSMVARVTVDGGGNLTHSDANININGAINPGAIMIPSMRFEIGGIAGLRVFTGPTLLHEGGLSANGNVILLANRESGHATVRVLVRQGQSSGAASVQGTWSVTGFVAGMPGYVSLLGEATFDGSADGTWGTNANLDGTPGWGSTASTDYGIAIDGQASVLWPGVSAIYGGAVPGFTLLGGPLTPTRGPCLYVLIR